MKFSPGHRYIFHFPGTDRKEFVSLDLVAIPDTEPTQYELVLADMNVRINSPGMKNHVKAFEDKTYTGNLDEMQGLLQTIVSDTRWFGWMCDEEPL